VILVHYKIVAAFLLYSGRGIIRDVMQDSNKHKLYTGFKRYLNADF